jgi:hypothetical protein
MKELTKKKIIKDFTDQLNECLESGNAEDYDLKKKVIGVDLKEQTITIKFDYHIVDGEIYLAPF